MAAVASGNVNSISLRNQEQSHVPSHELSSTVLLNIVEECFTRVHPSGFFCELRVRTGFKGNTAQRMDAFALNCLPHTSMRRVCYEVKTSRADFLCEIKQPLKRRVGLRYSNEFYFDGSDK
jgi:hypothetical protein